MTVCNKIPIAINLALHNENTVHNPKTVLVYTGIDSVQRTLSALWSGSKKT